MCFGSCWNQASKGIITNYAVIFSKCVEIMGSYTEILCYYVEIISNCVEIITIMCFWRYRGS